MCASLMYSPATVVDEYYHCNKKWVFYKAYRFSNFKQCKFKLSANTGWRLSLENECQPSCLIAIGFDFSKPIKYCIPITTISTGTQGSNFMKNETDKTWSGNFFINLQPKNCSQKLEALRTFNFRTNNICSHDKEQKRRQLLISLLLELISLSLEESPSLHGFNFLVVVLILSRLSQAVALQPIINFKWQGGLNGWHRTALSPFSQVGLSFFIHH